jgi:hypothetical protein
LYAPNWLRQGQNDLVHVLFAKNYSHIKTSPPQASDLPILQGDQVIGLVSIGDLVNWIITAQSVTLNQLERYITGHYPGAD